MSTRNRIHTKQRKFLRNSPEKWKAVVDDRSAEIVVEQGVRYAELRAILRVDFDEDAPATTITECTKGQAHLLYSGCIGNRQGRVNKRTHSALVARLVLREFS